MAKKKKKTEDAASTGFDDTMFDRVNEDMGPSAEGEAAGAGTNPSPKSEKPMKVKNNLQNPQAVGYQVLQAGEEIEFYESEMTERYMKVIRHAINTGALKQVN